MMNQGMTVQTTEKVLKEAEKVIIGQGDFLRSLLVCLFSGGHALIEGVPGLAKTLSVRVLSRIMDVPFRRIQFTPDMMPSDITGTNMYDLKSQTFHLKKGPIFTGFLLADEINRTPPKTQAALLEAMEEARVSIDGTDYELEQPFMVFATQNPIEYEGTYPLPEAQLDRFLMKLVVDYPSQEDEKILLRQIHGGFNARDFGNIQIGRLIDGEIIRECQKEIASITVEESILSYITAITQATRQSPHLLLGGSPRASAALLLSGKTLAAMEGRDFVIPDDIKSLALPVLRHRVMVAPESEIEGVKADQVIGGILDQVKIPR